MFSVFALYFAFAVIGIAAALSSNPTLLYDEEEFVVVVSSNILIWFVFANLLLILYYIFVLLYYSITRSLRKPQRQDFITKLRPPTAPSSTTYITARSTKRQVTFQETVQVRLIPSRGAYHPYRHELWMGMKELQETSDRNNKEVYMEQATESFVRKLFHTHEVHPFQDFPVPNPFHPAPLFIFDQSVFTPSLPEATIPSAPVPSPTIPSIHHLHPPSQDFPFRGSLYPAPLFISDQPVVNPSIPETTNSSAPIPSPTSPSVSKHPNPSSVHESPTPSVPEAHIPSPTSPPVPSPPPTIDYSYSSSEVSDDKDDSDDDDDWYFNQSESLLSELDDEMNDLNGLSILESPDDAPVPAPIPSMVNIPSPSPSHPFVSSLISSSDISNDKDNTNDDDEQSLDYSESSMLESEEEMNEQNLNRLSWEDESVDIEVEEKVKEVQEVHHRYPRRNCRPPVYFHNEYDKYY
jgi:hypothetical protein